jgi:hypothetical protein
MRLAVTLCSLALLTAGCGGGGSSGGGSAATISTTPSGPNVVTVIVDAGPAGTGTINSPFTSVTVCSPGGSNCATIDHVLVDTGSTGLRLAAEVLPASLILPQKLSSGGAPLYECVQFADGYSWGPVRTADVQIGGETAAGLPIQTIGDTGAPPVPADCPNGSPIENSVQTLAANGVLGIGVFREDCGSACVGATVPATYYGCTSSACTATTATLAQQLQTPVYRFGTDNNGVQLQLPAVGAAGALGSRGYLIFGIDTQSNNRLGTATALALSPVLGTLKTIYQGRSLNNSFIDSGSNGYFFADSTLAQCTDPAAQGFYCPAVVQSLSATIQGTTGISSSVNFSVANAQALVTNNPTYSAFQNLGGSNPLGSSFDWGLPFFYGRNVYFAIEGQGTSAGTGPYVAF